MQPVDDNTKALIDRDPFAKRLGIEVLAVKPGWAKTSLKLRDEDLNFLGMVHGAVIFSLADAAFAASSNSFGTKAVALSVSIDFMSAAEPGDELSAEVELVSRAGKMGCYNMKVENSAGKTIAQCRGRPGRACGRRRRRIHARDAGQRRTGAAGKQRISAFDAWQLGDPARHVDPNRRGRFGGRPDPDRRGPG